MICFMAQKHNISYSSWSSMMTRCFNKKRKSFNFYGGRGITVCKEWRKFESFLSDMGEKPKGYTIDRIDPNGNYCKSNCRWIKRSEQPRTTRKYLSISECMICGGERGNRKGRCSKCNEFFKRNGFERPAVGNVLTQRRLDNMKKPCLTCKKLLYWDNRRPVKGMCHKCYMAAHYLRNNP